MQGPPAFAAGHTARACLRGGRDDSRRAVKAAGDRGQAVAQAGARGVAKLAADLHRQGKVAGVLGLGGSAGTTIGTAAMRALPFGVPKLMVSTLASGQVQPYVGVRDVMMMYSVVDISGLNRISRTVLDNAAAAMAGMVQVRKSRFQVAGIGRQAAGDRDHVRRDDALRRGGAQVIEAAGYEVLVFHATGTGGRTMEGLIRDGLIAGVLDITTTELADELVGGVLVGRAGPAHRRGAGEGAAGDLGRGAGHGQLRPARNGAGEVQGPPVLPAQPDRHADAHHAGGERTGSARRSPRRPAPPTARRPCCVPLRGVSAIDAEGKPFWWPEADAALFQSVRNWVAPAAWKSVELDLHINDPAFAKACAEKLLGMMGK